MITKGDRSAQKLDKTNHPGKFKSRRETDILQVSRMGEDHPKASQ